MAFPIDTPAEMIGQLYVGYFGRAADPDGLNYWITQFNAGMSLQAIANSFAVQPEATALYSYLAAPAVGDPAAFVTAIYQDLFNRGPDAGGLAYWVNQLTVQGTPPGQMVLNIISGAQGADKTSVENKTHVAVDYAQKFVNNNLTWIGIDNIQGARDVVVPVTSDPATVTTAILQIDGIITQELTNPQNISLTPNLSTIQSGGTVAITLHADPSQANKDFQYTITGIDSSVVKGGQLSGTVKLGSDSTAVINVGTVVTAAQLNTPNETIKVTVGPISTNVGLTEGTQVVTQTGPVNEGNSFNFTVTTSGVAAGSANGLVQTYTISGAGLAHIPVAERSGTVTLDNNGVATVTVHTLASLADSGTTQVTITVGNDAPVNVVINETAVQTITPSSGTIQEGAQVIFKVTTTGVAGSAVAGQVENWTLSGAGAGQINGPLSGTVTLDQDGTATVTVSTLVNGLNDLSPANLVFTLLSGAVPVGTATVGINQGSQVTTNTGPVNEGTAFSFTVTTTGVAPGSVEGRIESYTLTGPGLAHIPVAERSGTVVLDANGSATVTVHTLTDLTGAGDTTVDIAVGNNAASTVTIHETAVQTVTPNVATILEGGAVVFTINTAGVAGGSVAGQVETWTLSGAAADQINGPLSGTVTLDSNGSATVTVQTLTDALNDFSPQDLVFTLKSGASQTAQATVNVSQGSQVTTNTSPVNEGSAFSFTVTTSGVAPGSVAGRQENYTITGAGVDHIPVAERSGIVTLDASGNATITVHTLADLANPGGTTTVSIQVANNAASTVTINEVATQSVSASSATILEGGSVVFTINTINVLGSSVAGQTETWTLGGAAAGQVNGPLSGTVTLDSNGSATVTVQTNVDALNDGLLKNLTFTLKSGSTVTAVGAVDVLQGTQVTTAPASVQEGNAFTFEVTTTGVAQGSVEGRIETYTLSGAGIDHIPAAERTGQVKIDANGKASVTVHTQADLGSLGSHPVTIQVGNNAPVTVDIQDTAFQTVTVSPASADINQGQSLTFTIHTFGVAAGALAGTTQTWSLIGSGTNQVTGGVLSGTVTLDANNSAVVTVGTDFSIINGPLTQNLTFRLNSGGQNVDSPTVTIHESTLTVTPPALPVVEGNQVTYTITGVNIPNGTTYTYTLSGDAIGNVVPASQINGTVTINNNTATVVVNTLSNDPSGLTKGLTLTIDQVPTAKGTAQIAETAPISFILTTGTDNFVGNPNGKNTFFAVANSNPLTASSTLGQNDNLDGKGTIDGPNTLFLQTTGLLPQTINAFTTNNIQIFNINPGQQLGGTTIDMSSVFGMTKVINANASGKLTLLNLTQAADAELVNPSDIFGSTVDMAMQYQNNPQKPTTQNLLLDPTVSPITGLPNSRFWVNVDKLSITSSGPGTNGLITINGATNGFGATALTSIIMHGDTSFVLGVDGSKQAGAAYTGAGFGSSANMLDLRDFRGTFFNVGDPGNFPGITSVGGLTIIAGVTGNAGNNSIDGRYVPAAGFTGATQNGGPVTIAVGGNFDLDIWKSNVIRQSIQVFGNVDVEGFPFPGSPDANGGLLLSAVETTGAGSAQNYQGFNGGLTGSIKTNDGDLSIGTNFRVNGIINEVISTGTGQAIVFGGNSLFTINDTTLDFSGAGTTGFHGSLKGANTMDKFTGGNGVNTLIIDPMITNANAINIGLKQYGTGWATGVQHITLESLTPWGGTVGGVGGVLPTNTVDLGLLNLNSNFVGINTGFAQTIHINGPLTGIGTGQTFKDAVSGDTFILDNSQTGVPGGSMQGQVMAFDFALPTANNTLNFTANNVNSQGGIPQLVLRDFEINSAAANQQNPITTANLQMNRSPGGQNNIVTTLDTLNRLSTLNLSGTSDRFNDGTNVQWIIAALGGAQTLSTITGGDQNYNLLQLIPTYQSAAGGTITLGNGTNSMGANAGNWTITSGKVPGAGTEFDSGNNFVTLSPQLGNVHTVKTGGGWDSFEIGFNLAPGGGIVDIMSGAGNDHFLWNQAGIFPSLNSAQKVNAGDGRDTFELANGAINENDSLWGQITNTEIFMFAFGTWNNSLLLNFFANGSGLDTIVTRGNGSSNVIFEGTGFTHSMRYEIAPATIGGGDTGHDAIIVAALPSGTNKITVATDTSGYNNAFQTGLNTSAINPVTLAPTKSGIFANNFSQNAATPEGNVLELQADNATANVFQLGGYGTLNMHTIIGKSGGAASQTIWLVNDPALGTRTTTVDLTDVDGNTIVYANGSTLRETITGGRGDLPGGNTNVLFGGFAADTIKAMGTAHSFGANFIWGGGDFTGGAQDTLSGVQGGADGSDLVGTVFYINAVAESPGGPFDPTFNDRDVHITNFHVATDTLLINPAALVLADIPFFLGDAADYGNALALLAGGGALQTQAVYQLDQKVMWIDADNNGLLNQLDIRVFIDFASPGFNPGTFNFGALLGLTTGAQAAAYADGVLNPFSNVDFSDTLLPGQWLFGGGPGNNDKLTLLGGDVADGILIGFEHLEIPFLSEGTLSIRQWNDFYPNITGGGVFSTVHFRDGLAPFENTLTILNQIGHYDFTQLTAATGGITVFTEDFNNTGPSMQAGSTLVATDFNDTFWVDEDDLQNAMTIDGGKGTDTLNVDVTLTFGSSFGQTAGGAGTTDAVVLNTENLNLLDAVNNVGFNLGTQFTKVIGGSNQDFIRDPENLAGSWFLDVMGGSGLFDTNIIQVNNASNDLSPGTIQATGGFVALNIDAGGPSNTTMKFGQYQLFEASAIGPFLGIFLSGGSNFGNTTITFSNQVTGGAVLDEDVGNWVFSSADDTFALGENSQSIDVSSGGADTAILNLGGTYNGTWVGGSSNDTVVFAGNVNISGINGGGATTFGQADFTGVNRNVSMTYAQHNGFAQAFLNTGGTQTINLVDGGTATGDAGIEQYNLNTGPGSNDDIFTVAADNGALTTGNQSVNFDSGTDVVKFGNGTFSGKMTGLGVGDTTSFIGNANVSGVNGGSKIGSSIVTFNGLSLAVVMTLDQHNDFVQPFLGTGSSTQTITLTTSGTATGDVGIENYVLASGNDKFTVTPNNLGLVGGAQNVDISSGGNDQLIFGAGTFSGKMVGGGSGDTVVFTGGTTNISGINSGAAVGPTAVDFSNTDVNASMTLAQHNGFNQPFGNTGGAGKTQTINLTTSGVATGDGGIEQYNLFGGNDTFTVAPDSGAFKQNVDFGGGTDTAVFGTGKFTGNMTSIGAGDTTKFIGNADISGINGGASFTDNVDFNNANVSVSITLAQHNGYITPFGNTGNTQTITLTTSGVATGDVGIENYVLASGNDTFKVTPDNGQLVGGSQNVDISSGGADVIQYNSPFSGKLVGAGADDTVQFLGGAGLVDIAKVNGGAATGAKFADFSDANVEVKMTVAQHNGLHTVDFNKTANTQTIFLADSGTATGDVGIENYVLASGDDTFTVTKNNAGLVGLAQNVDISSGGNDTINYGAGKFTGKLVGGGAGDTVQFTGGTTDVSGVNGGTVMGPKAVSFSDTDVDVSMSLVQHNDFTKPFTNTGGAGKVQTITLTTDGTTTGDAGIEQYVLGQDGSNSNVFTIGKLGQSVTGRADDDVIINPFGGLTGTILGGTNNAKGDTLILQSPNTEIKIGSGGIENLTLQAPGNSIVKMDVAFHNGLNPLTVIAPGASDKFVMSSNGTLTGVFGIENYDLAAGANNFTFSDSQTGTVTGNTDVDIFNATAAQVAGATKIDGDGGILDVLNITTDAGGLNLNTQTTNIEIYFLLAGSTSQVIGLNVTPLSGVVYNAVGNTQLKFGTGTVQAYNGGLAGLGQQGVDKVTFGTVSILGIGVIAINTNDADDIVTSTVGGAWASIGSVTLNGGAGQDTLELAGGDDLTPAFLSPVSVTNFENLVIAFNGSVTMTNAQHNQFVPLSTVATGNNTITIATDGGAGFSGTTMAQVENYILGNGAGNHTYTIAHSGQTVTDLDSSGGQNTANINAGLSNVTLIATAGASYVVNSLGGGTNLKVVLDAADIVNLAGGHTGVDIFTDLDADTVNVTGSVTGKIDGGAGADTLHLNNTADIVGTNVVAGSFETLDFSANASVSMTAATWDQFVNTNGGGSVTGGTGVETVNLSTTTTSTTAFTGTNPIEKYNLTNSGNDTFKANVTTTPIVTVDLVGGGTDTVTINDANATIGGPGVGPNNDGHANVLNFKSGGGSGFDVLAVQHSGTAISDGNYQSIGGSLLGTNVSAGVEVVNMDPNSGGIFAIGDFPVVWSQAVARAYFDTPINMIALGDYTFVAYSGADAYIMAVDINTANTFADAGIDLIGVLQGVGNNSMLASNFA